MLTQATQEFPDWTPPTGFVIPDGFADESYRNDVCPNFTKDMGDTTRVTLWVDYEDPAMREFQEKPGRYAIYLYGDEHSEPLQTLYVGDDLDEALAVCRGVS